MPRVLVVYAIDPGSTKADSWSDGFTKGMSHISGRHDIRWCNILDPYQAELLNSEGFDFVLAKSNWHWIVDHGVRRRLWRSGVPRGIVISGVGAPPSRRAMSFYDVLWYQTHWYASKVRDHSLSRHAFGIDTDVMRPNPVEAKEFDWIFVGSLVPHKRPERLLEKQGRRLAVTGPSQEDDLRQMLVDDGVEVLPWVSQMELASLLRRSRRALIPCKVEGGGERAVLEARACGIPVEVADDNPKLQELLTSPIYDHKYYGDQIADGIESAIRARMGRLRRGRAAWASWTR